MPADSSPFTTYLGLREQVLRGPKSPALKPNQLWAVLMDWPLASAMSTVVAVADGTVSIYLSSGGGWIGGSPTHTSIRDAGRAMLLAAGKAASLFRATNDIPLPEPGRVRFYAVTSALVVFAEAAEAELSAGTHPLVPLANAAQNVITQYRLIS